MFDNPPFPASREREHRGRMFKNRYPTLLIPTKTDLKENQDWEYTQHSPGKNDGWKTISYWKGNFSRAKRLNFRSVSRQPTHPPNGPTFSL